MNTTGTRRWWALGALSLSMLAVGLDATVINIALPTLSTALHASTADLQWFVDAYSLVLAAMLLPAGLLGDRFGRKKLLLVALVLFGAASAGCAYAPSAGALIAARALLGLGGAFLMPLSLAVLPVLFTEQERPRAIAIWVTANAVSFPIGPIAGGWLLGHFWWGAVFLINVPVTIIALIAVSVLLPESRSARRPRLDPLGVLASSVGLAGLTYGVIDAGVHGWGDAAALAALGAGIVALLAFVLWERHISRRQAGQPLVDLALFRSRSFTWGTILATLVSFAMFGMLFVVPQYFQAVEGADALGSGLRLLPIIAGLLVGARLGGRLASRAGAPLTVALGFALLAAGLLVGASSAVDSGYGIAAAWITVIGAGLGFAMPTAMDAALSALSAERSGVGSALIQALRQVGGVIGVAVLGTVLNSAYHDGLDVTHLPAPIAHAVRESVSAGVAVAQRLDSAPLLAAVRGAFVHGMDAMLALCGGTAIVGIVLALAFLPRRDAALGATGAEQVELDHEGVA